MNENEEALNVELFLKALYNVIHRGDEYRIVEGVDEGSLRLSEGKTVTGISMHTENNKEQVTISGAVLAYERVNQMVQPTFQGHKGKTAKAKALLYRQANLGRKE